MKVDLAAMSSRYHRVKQNDGRGDMIILQHEDDPTKATVLHVNLTADDASQRLEAYRSCERRPIRGVGAMGVDITERKKHEQELIQFPRGSHDDQVDALAWIGLGLTRMTTPLTQKEEEDEVWRKESREHLTLGRSGVTGY